MVEDRRVEGGRWSESKVKNKGEQGLKHRVSIKARYQRQERDAAEGSLRRQIRMT